MTEIKTNTVESAPITQAEELLDYQLNDRYLKQTGRVFLTGTQALIAIMLRQKRLDQTAEMNTAGFISGYRGSPLGAVDQAVWQAQPLLDENKIKFLAAINEDLAATAVLGTQQLEVEPDRQVEGVFSMWYGKGPGVDRAGDALKHGNAYGSSEHGGVLVVAGDDHGCASSSMSHQSDVAFMSAYIPTINPASIAEYLEFGAYGFALSRFSGMWVGFKAISETVEGGSSVELPATPNFVTPTDFDMPEGGLNYRWPDLPGMQIESRMLYKKRAALAFARANPIDRTVYNVKGAKYGIITTGKAYHDVLEALALLGIDQKQAEKIGLDIYKVGLVWPLECQGAERFMAGKQEVLVVEEKRGIIESQLKEYIYDRATHKPDHILGKYTQEGEPLISWVEELMPSTLAPIFAQRLTKIVKGLDFSDALNDLAIATADPIQTIATVKAHSGQAQAKRAPYFCSGCPHNTSTKVPEGSKALAGIGCHFMASWMDRDTSDLIQMGGEGVNWVAKSLFLNETKEGKKPHVFQNLGDGTYFHSGYMAIRQSIAANANVTYKILFNEAVAMTGGQPVDGSISVAQMASQIIAEGALHVVIVSDEPDEITKLGGYPSQVEVYHRDELDTVQRELREIEGVTALIYQQGCAAEKRRKRKRKLIVDPAKRVIINDLVCEGCGDCSTQSNCLSIVPKQTEFGRKRMIDQSSCNKDFSCVKGFCPSFITVEGGQLRKPEIQALNPDLLSLLNSLPIPNLPVIDRAYDLLVGGVGGTGVVTIGAIITMAAHLQSKGASVLDFMGFAQKGGTVLSYVRLSESPDQLNQVRVDAGAADAAVICDLVVGTDPRSLSVMRQGKTQVAVNTDILPTADMIHNRDIDFAGQLRLKKIKDRCNAELVDSFNASHIARQLLGDSVFSNMLLLGYAWQKGIIPISQQAIERAISLNAVAVEKNNQAFAIGRAAYVDLDLVTNSLTVKEEASFDESLESIVKRRAEFLSNYQNAQYGQKYIEFVDKIKNNTHSLQGSEALVLSVAKNLFKLMAYKDEYEVARLHSDKSFKRKIEQQFSGDYRLKYHLAPPVMNRGLDAQGRPKKTTFGSWMGSAFGVLQHFKFLRGTAFDIFSYTQERKLERQLIIDYKQDLEIISANLKQSDVPSALEFSQIPDQIRGYGPVKLETIKRAQHSRDALLKKLS